MKVAKFSACKFIVSTSALVLGAAMASSAAVTPVIIRLEVGVSYVVPAGKTLMVRQITYESGSAQTPSKIFFSSGGSTNTFYLFENATNDPSPAKGTVRLREPLAIPSGYLVEAAKFSVFEGTYGLFGYLADAGDLYVGLTGALPSHIDSLERSRTNAFLALRTFTPAPARVSVETSPDLVSWTNEPSADCLSLSTTQKQIRLVAQSDHAFYRAIARRRNLD